MNCWIANKEGQGPRRNFDARFSLCYGKIFVFLIQLRPIVFNLEVAGPTEVVNHLWKGRQKVFYAAYIAVLHLLYPSLDGGCCVIVGCYNGLRYKNG